MWISDRAVATDEVVQAWAVGGGSTTVKALMERNLRQRLGRSREGNGSLLKACPGAGCGTSIWEGCLGKEAGWSVNVG